MAAKRMTIRSETSKKNRTCKMMLSNDIASRLKDWKDKCKPESESEFVFPRELAIRTVCEEFESIRDQAGLPDLKIKHFRSTWATEMAQKEPLGVVQKHLRHSSPTTTAHYYVNGESALRKAAESHEPL